MIEEAPATILAMVALRVSGNRSVVTQRWPGRQQRRMSGRKRCAHGQQGSSWSIAGAMASLSAIAALPVAHYQQRIVSWESPTTTVGGGGKQVNKVGWGRGKMLISPPLSCLLSLWHVAVMSTCCRPMKAISFKYDWNPNDDRYQGHATKSHWYSILSRNHNKL